MDTLRAALRRLLAGGGWVAEAAAVDALGGEVDDDLARRTWGRLAAAGWTDPGDEAGRLAAGGARVVRERLQKLARAGEVEAAGDGPGRVYRVKLGGGGMGSDKPKPKKDYLPLERLAFDRRL